MNRLLTAGCSFTKHCWPTWADYLGKQYIWHKQIGFGGYDNSNIARSIIKFANPGDTVVVMWSGYDRWSFYDENQNEWIHNGWIGTNKDFYTNHFSAIERFTTTMDYVSMVDLHSKQVGYDCFHFPAFNWFKAEKFSNVPFGLREIYDSYSPNNIKNNFLLTKSLLEYQEDNNEVFEITHKYIKKDTHPTPITHWNYLKQVIAKNIGINIDNTLESTVLEDQSKVLAGDIG